MWMNKRYTYPTREAFRFHFEEPPAAPLGQDETKRMREVMHWDKRPLYASLDTDYKMVSSVF